MHYAASSSVLQSLATGSRTRRALSSLRRLDKWEACTTAKVAMFARTHTPEAPWTVIKSNDKKRARLEAMRSLPAGVDYDGKDHDAVGQPDPLIIGAPADMREIGHAQQSPTPIAGYRA
jgi:hypothetical protein